MNSCALVIHKSINICCAMLGVLEAVKHDEEEENAMIADETRGLWGNIALHEILGMHGIELGLLRQQLETA